MSITGGVLLFVIGFVLFRWPLAPYRYDMMSDESLISEPQKKCIRLLGVLVMVIGVMISTISVLSKIFGILSPEFEFGHEVRSDIRAGQFVTTALLEVFLNPFELIGFAPAE